DHVQCAVKGGWSPGDRRTKDDIAAGRLVGDQQTECTLEERVERDAEPLAQLPQRGGERCGGGPLPAGERSRAARLGQETRWRGVGEIALPERLRGRPVLALVPGDVIGVGPRRRQSWRCPTCLAD